MRGRGFGPIDPTQIAFKREFCYAELFRLWEALWSRHRGEKFHLLCVVALLRRHRSDIIDGGLEFDTLLQFVNQLAYRIDVEARRRSAFPTLAMLVPS